MSWRAAAGLFDDLMGILQMMIQKFSFYLFLLELVVCWASRADLLVSISRSRVISQVSIFRSVDRGFHVAVFESSTAYSIY